MPTFDELIYPATLKLKRAKHHINDLNAMIEQFLEKKPFRLLVRLKPKIREGALFTKTYKSIPIEDIAPIIGDAVHNLRAALDLTIYTMVGARAPEPWRLEFPFPREANGLEGAISRAQVKFAGEKVVEAIRAIKPYPGGNDTLAGLHKLDVLDKHRIILLARYVPEITFDQIAAITGVPMTDGVLRYAGPEDGEICKFSPKFGNNRQERRAVASRGDWEEEANLQPAFQIALGEGMPFHGSPVIECLRMCADAVDQAVRDLIEAYQSPDNVFPD